MIDYPRKLQKLHTGKISGYTVCCYVQIVLYVYMSALIGYIIQPMKNLITTFSLAGYAYQ